MDKGSGLITPARQIPSPNCDDFPASTEPELLVIHNISLPPGEFGGNAICELFCNSLDPDEHPYFREIAGLKVSAHVLIRRDGSLIQFVPFTRRAWHAGVSCWRGRERCNDFSLGIELEGTDDIPYSEQQYQSLDGVVLALSKAYRGIGRDAIVGHSDIAPGRKTDPGASFNWQRLFSKLV